MAKYLDPKNDLIFKLIFGTHKNLCISLLNNILPFEGEEKIVDITYDPTELLPEIEALKDSIVDVRCTDTAGRHFIVEMQMFWTVSFKQRILLNASKVYIEQLDAGKSYDTLEPVYALAFVNQNFEKSPEMDAEYLHHYKIVNIAHTEKQIKGLEFIFVELRKFTPQNRAEKKLHELWLRFLTEIDESTESVPEELLENEEVKEAVKCAERAAYTKAQLAYYNAIRDRALKERSSLADARREGETAGIAQGIAQGREEGIAEANRETARKLKALGMPLEQIKEITGLDEVEVQINGAK
jgi:predicted transposase/invertase (TIGR01784 family)